MGLTDTQKRAVELLKQASATRLRYRGWWRAGDCLEYIKHRTIKALARKGIVDIEKDDECGFWFARLVKE